MTGVLVVSMEYVVSMQWDRKYQILYVTFMWLVLLTEIEKLLGSRENELGLV
jgi:hypothetical protein